MRVGCGVAARSSRGHAGQEVLPAAEGGGGLGGGGRAGGGGGQVSPGPAESPAGPSGGVRTRRQPWRWRGGSLFHGESSSAPSGRCRPGEESGRDGTARGAVLGESGRQRERRWVGGAGAAPSPARAPFRSFTALPLGKAALLRGHFSFQIPAVRARSSCYYFISEKYVTRHSSWQIVNDMHNSEKAKYLNKLRIHVSLCREA